MSVNCDWGMQGRAPCEYLSSIRTTFGVNRISSRSKRCRKDEVNLATLAFGEITRYYAVVSGWLVFSHELLFDRDEWIVERDGREVR